MDFTNMSDQVIKKYQEDEQIMIRLFVQWCTNNKLDPMKLYLQAYPEQLENLALKQVLDDKEQEDPIDIDNETMLDVLQLFGNDDLAFIVADEIGRLSKRQR